MKQEIDLFESDEFTNHSKVSLMILFLAGLKLATMDRLFSSP